MSTVVHKWPCNNNFAMNWLCLSYMSWWGRWRHWCFTIIESSVVLFKSSLLSPLLQHHYYGVCMLVHDCWQSLKTREKNHGLDYMKWYKDNQSLLQNLNIRKGTNKKIGHAGLRVENGISSLDPTCQPNPPATVTEVYNARDDEDHQMTILRDGSPSENKGF